MTQRMPDGMALNDSRIGSRSDREVCDAVTAMMSAISKDYVRMVSRIVREAGLKATRRLHGLTGSVARATRALAINTLSCLSLRVGNNLSWTVQAIREDLIARQLGKEKARSPLLLPEDDVARNSGSIRGIPLLLPTKTGCNHPNMSNMSNRLARRRSLEKRSRR